jgi:hypothetical protein
MPNYGLQVYLQARTISASKFARSLPPSAILQTRLIPTSRYISKLAQLCSQSLSPNSLDYCVQVYLQTSSITITECITPTSLDYGLQVHLQTRSITLLECLSKFTQSRPPRVSPNMLNYHLQVHLQTDSVMASECISEFTQSSFSGALRIAPKHGLQPVQICHVYLSSYIDT